MRRALSLLILATAASTATAQVARWSAGVAPVQTAGMHAVVLSADLLGCARADLGDIRLLDSTGAEVPYVMRESMRASGPERFIAFNLLRNAVLKHSTEVEIERPAEELIEELHVWIKPIDADKRVRITGSDDRQQWYMVKDEHVALQGARGDPPHQVLLLRIPRSDYRYLRLSLNDSLTAPMKVLGVGRFVPERAPESVYTAPIELPFVRHDGDKRTVIRFALPRALFIERLSFLVDDTLPFVRRVELGRWRTVEDRGRYRTANRPRVERMGSFTVRHGEGSAFTLLPARLDTFELRIDNGDDRPLRIRAVKAQCLERLLLARLEAGMRYRLTAGDAQLAPPQYDMALFAHDLPAPLDTLEHDDLIAANGVAPDGPAFNPAQGWIWAAILALMALMGLFAVRMLRKPTV